MMGEQCQRCGNFYRTVYRIPDDVWRKITDLNRLCPRCCDWLARHAGISLYWEANPDRYPSEATRDAKEQLRDACLFLAGEIDSSPRHGIGCECGACCFLDELAVREAAKGAE